MIDFCNECSSRRQLSRYFKQSFAKKLLVAISLIVILAMCITPTEARSLEDRSNRSENMPQTKEISKPHHRNTTVRITTERHRRRHDRHIRKQPVENEKLPKSPYATEMRKIIQKVKNTRSYFNGDQNMLKMATKPREVAHKWLPGVKFVDIHFHNYNSSRSKKTGSSGPERKFKYLIPKLYKSLVEYEMLFRQFESMELIFPDTPTDSYKNSRKKLLNNTAMRLNSTIQQLNDSMLVLHFELPPLKLKLDFRHSLPLRINDTSQCQETDLAAFRAYGRLLDNWYREFRCPRKGKNSKKKLCVEWEKQLRYKENRQKSRQQRR